MAVLYGVTILFRALAFSNDHTHVHTIPLMPMHTRFKTAVVIAVHDDMTADAEQPQGQNIDTHRRHSPMMTLDVQFLHSGVVEQGIPMGTDSFTRVRPLGINQYHYSANYGANQAQQLSVFTPSLRRRAGDGDVSGTETNATDDEFGQQTSSCSHCGIAQHEHVYHTRLSLLELSDSSIGESSTSKRKLRELGGTRGVAVLFMKNQVEIF